MSLLYIPAISDTGQYEIWLYYTGTGNFEYNLDLSDYPPGPIDVVIVVTDSEGNTSTETLTYYIDITPPVISVTNPMSRPTVRSSFLVRIPPHFSTFSLSKNNNLADSIKKVH